MADTTVHASMATSANFTIIALPDTQEYAASHPEIFTNQTQWIVSHKDVLNIVYVTGEGDIVSDESQDIQWRHADAAYTLLENPTTTHLPYGIPYTIPPGNHDQPTTLFNQYFGVSRFTGRSYYGGHYSTTNNNHYVLFNTSDMSFIAIGLDYNPSAAVLNWADGLLQTYSNRRAIVVEHCILNVDASWEGNGQTIYDTLKDNPNLFLMLCGHMHSENRRTETYNGHTVNILFADYQTRSNGGNGYLRIMTFFPATNQIKIKTYSPYLNRYETDANSQFSLTYTMYLPLTCDAGGPYSGETGQNIHFTGSVTGENTPCTWVWAFGDGETSTNQNPDHIYTTPGNYNVTLSVTDATSATTQDTADVSVYFVENHPPVATDDTVIVTENTLNNQINVRANDHDIDGDPFTITSVTLPSYGTSSSDESYVFYTPTANYYGSDHFTYTITDSSGNSDTATVTITISSSGGDHPITPPPPSNQAPIADASAGEPYQGLIHTEITFNGSRSYDHDNDIINWFWEFGDNTNGTGEITRHTYLKAGIYTVNLTVIDNDGQTNVDTTTCVIKQPDRSPTKPIITGPINGTINTIYSYTVVSIDTDNDTIHYTINWGEPVPQSNEFMPNATSYKVNHSWAAAGRYIVTVTVSDNQTTSSSKITVYIDAVQTGDIGYLFDNNHDGIYDTFHNDTTSQNIIVSKKGSDYIIDSNGDDKVEYIFAEIKGLTPYQPLKTSGFKTVLFIFAITCQPLKTSAIEIVLFICAMIVADVLWKKKKNYINSLKRNLKVIPMKTLLLS